MKIVFIIWLVGTLSQGKRFLFITITHKNLKNPGIYWGKVQILCYDSAQSSTFIEVQLND